MKGKRFRLFGVSTEIIPQNRCLVFKERNRGDVFEYHNQSKNEMDRILIFSRIIEDKKIRDRLSIYCSTCRKKDFSEEKPVPRTETVRDEEAIRRVNEHIRGR